jgi:hypothetical protein
VGSKNFKIEQVFNVALTAWSTTQSIPVAWDGKPYTPTAGSKYVSQVLIPARPENVAIGKDVIQRRAGIYQIDVYSSTANAKKDADTIIESLEALFKIGYPVTYNGLSVQVTNFYPDPHGTDEGWYRVSISIFYRTEL